MVSDISADKVFMTDGTLVLSGTGFITGGMQIFFANWNGDATSQLRVDGVQAISADVGSGAGSNFGMVLGNNNSATQAVEEAHGYFFAKSNLASDAADIESWLNTRLIA